MKKKIIIIITGLLCLAGCSAPTPSAEIERELDAIYMADPDYYLDVLSGSDEICVLNELLESGASGKDLQVAMQQVRQRIKNDKNNKRQ